MYPVESHLLTKAEFIRVIYRFKGSPASALTRPSKNPECHKASGVCQGTRFAYLHCNRFTIASRSYCRTETKYRSSFGSGHCWKPRANSERLRSRRTIQVSCKAVSSPLVTTNVWWGESVPSERGHRPAADASQSEKGPHKFDWTLQVRFRG